MDKHLINDIHSDAVCQYCNAAITDGPTENCGGSLIHSECYRLLMSEPNGETPEPTEPTDDDMEYAYQRYYGFGTAERSPRIVGYSHL